MKNLLRIIIFISFITICTGCNLKKEVMLSGRTMGTTYHIKVILWFYNHPENLKKMIDQRLKQINKSMSTYDRESEISRFNNIRSIDSPFRASNDFINVLTIAENIYKITDGAWDCTVNPLVKIWGFGNIKKKKVIPEKSDIEKYLSVTGFKYIEISKENGFIKKKIPEVTLDLGSIAKGYAVDQIAILIRKNSIANCLVEIGGEVFASGRKINGENWKVGINMPKPDVSFNKVYKALSLLENKAMATSGKYRNFFDYKGKRYSHLINPRIGYPVSNNILSVSVISDSCTFADGMATAIMILGIDDGLKVVNNIKDTECFIIAKGEGETFVNYRSDNFQ